jgi:tetratricopeptide (TPR) repeat protein
MKTVRSTVLTVLLAMTLNFARAEWRFDAETGWVYDSNLSNSDRPSDEKNDWAWKTDLRLGNGFQLSRDLRLNLAGDLRSQLWDQFDSFNEIGAGASAGLRYRFGLGRQAPWILVEERIGYDRFHETVRSGWDESLRLRGGIAISHRIALEAGYTFRNFAALDDFFDEQGQSGNARVIAYPYQENVPRMDITCYLAKESWVKANPDVARRFKRAIERATTDLINATKEVRDDWVAKYTGAKPEVVAAMNLPEFTTEFNVPSLKANLDIAVRQKLAKPFDLGELLAQQGRLDEAAEHFASALEINPRFAHAWHNMGMILVQRGKLDEAIEEFSKAVEIDPRFADAYNKLGAALASKGRLDEAAANFAKAIEIDPAYASAHANLGSLYEQQGKIDDAVASYSTALRFMADSTMSAQTHFRLGKLLASTGYRREAIEHYREALKLKPDYAPAQQALRGIPAETNPNSPDR